MQAKFITEGTYTPDTIIAGNAHLLVGRQVTIAAGQKLPRGAVLGKVTADGKYKLSAKSASDGSEAPDLILAQDVDATDGDTAAMAYARGDFDRNALHFGADHTVETVAEPLRAKGITLLPTVA